MTPWYKSKTLWANAVAGVALLIQSHYGFVLDPELQAAILAFINFILRLVTKSPLDWSKSSERAEGGFINLRCLVELFLIGTALLMLAACATTSATAPAAGDTPQVLAGKSLLAVKSTIISAALAVDGLCRAGTMQADKCAQAKAAYELAKPAYDSAVDAYLLSVSQGGGDPAQFDRTLTRVQSLANNLLTLSGGLK